MRLRSGVWDYSWPLTLAMHGSAGVKPGWFGTRGQLAKRLRPHCTLISEETPNQDLSIPCMGEACVYTDVYLYTSTLTHTNT